MRPRRPQTIGAPAHGRATTRDEDTTMGHTMAARIAAPWVRTGGPSDEEWEKLVEQALGWTLTVLVAVIVTSLGLL